MKSTPAWAIRLSGGVAALLVLGILGATPAAAVPKTLKVTNSLTDEKGAPLGGIYWFRFALHRGRSDAKMMWSEEMYVAVDKGTYVVELGKERPIPQALKLAGLFLSIQIDGSEVQRLEVEEAMIAGGRTAGTSGAGAGPGSGCEKCKRAERAGDADRLGGLSVKQLTETLAKKQIQVGTSATFTSSVGDGEGSPFRLSCPPGFVVTGLKGKTGDQISSLQLVCSPLEAQ